MATDGSGEAGMAGERIGFVGLGTMGAAMAANLARAGHDVTAWNRTPGRAPELDELGVTRADKPGGRRGRRRMSSCVCVSDTPDVEAVLFGEGGVADGARPGSLVIDCSTIAPGATRDFAARLAERGVALVDAPVSGGSEGARKATLSIFVGGEPADVERARPVLGALGTDDHPRRPDRRPARPSRPSTRSSSPGPISASRRASSSR